MNTFDLLADIILLIIGIAVGAWVRGLFLSRKHADLLVDLNLELADFKRKKEATERIAKHGSHIIDVIEPGTKVVVINGTFRDFAAWRLANEPDFREETRYFYTGQSPDEARGLTGPAVFIDYRPDAVTAERVDEWRRNVSILNATRTKTPFEKALHDGVVAQAEGRLILTTDPQLRGRTGFLWDDSSETTLGQIIDAQRLSKPLKPTDGRTVAGRRTAAEARREAAKKAESAEGPE